ncbi:MAG: MerR family transcriptional regulator [Streptosporangiales bacterium]|nr:MerR family transcriptional regulator [Streptosporangiales bacterium]
MDGSAALTEDERLFPIGELARRTGLTVKTVRFWSDEGLVPPADRTPAGYRMYGQDALARLALVRTLRDLGVDLRTAQRVLAREVTVSEVAAAHADALDAHIKTLRLHHTVLRAVADRGATPEEMEIMNKLAQMSGEERRRLVTDFLDDVFAEVPGGTVEQMYRQALPDLPDEPSQQQVEAWVELAELIQDPDFKARAREMSVKGVEQGEQPTEEVQRAAQLVAELANQALADGIDPASEQARPIVDELAAAHARTGDDPSAPAFRTELADQLATFTDRRVERYWELIGTINGWSSSIPSMIAPYEWFIAGLRATA